MYKLFICCLFQSLIYSTSLDAQTSYTYFFEEGVSTLSQNEQNHLLDDLKLIEDLNSYSFLIKGYCNDIGTFSYNNVLSYNRANNIKEIILSIYNDVEIKIKGEGELALKLEEDTSVQRIFNRRVEITLNKGATFMKAGLEVGDIVLLGDVLFYSGKHKLISESYPVLDQLAEELKNNVQYHIIILGHVMLSPFMGKEDLLDDETGIKNLSTARAKEVYDFLIKKGIDENRLSYKGMKADVRSSRGGRYDKRVEVQITKITK